jgi:hypothetical protein
LSESVPNDKTLILTITAPIRLPSKTAAALEGKIRPHLAHWPAAGEVKDTIHGNRVRARLVNRASKRTGKVIGFVHNPDSDPDILFDVTQSLLESIGAKADKRAPARLSGDRWLVVANEDGLSQMETYRQLYSQLSIPTDFRKILMVLANGRVETLSG